MGLSERPISSNKYILGKGELEILKHLTADISKKQTQKKLLGDGILSSKAAYEKAINSLTEKKLVNLKGENLSITPEGKLLRDVLIKTRVIESEGISDGESRT